MTANRIEFGHGTHTGLRRDHNEDTYHADADLGLWLVADGMIGVFIVIAAQPGVCSVPEFNPIGGHSISLCTGRKQRLLDLFPLPDLS